MDWFAIEILTGLQKLACCSWERTPAAEVLPGTAQIWIEALTHGRSWDEGRDASRIRGAFLTLANTRTVWPGPVHFLQALPDSTQLRIAGPGERPVDPPELVKELRATADPVAEARELLGTREPTPADLQRAIRPTASRDALNGAERELQRHYGRDGKALAAGEGA